MFTVNPNAAQARENARQSDGKFGPQVHTQTDVGLGGHSDLFDPADPPDWVDEHENGTTYRWIHPVHGGSHRDGGPAVLSVNNEGQVVHRSWVFNGLLHREDGPAVEGFYDDGTPKYWAHHAKGAPLDGPSSQQFHPDGTLWRKNWYKDGAPHRSDGPAVEEYDRDGNLVHQEFWVDGQRVEGPVGEAEQTVGESEVEK